jgi:hypothetical protein
MQSSIFFGQPVTANLLEDARSQGDGFACFFRNLLTFGSAHRHMQELASKCDFGLFPERSPITGVLLLDDDGPLVARCVEDAKFA